MVQIERLGWLYSLGGFCSGICSSKYHSSREVSSYLPFPESGLGHLSRICLPGVILKGKRKPPSSSLLNARDSHDSLLQGKSQIRVRRPPPPPSQMVSAGTDMVIRRGSRLFPGQCWVTNCLLSESGCFRLAWSTPLVDSSSYLSLDSSFLKTSFRFCSLAL